MRRLVYVASAFVLVIAASVAVFSYARPPEQTGYEPASAELSMEIAGKTIALSVADTEAERVRGLSGKERLIDGEGMLFVFTSESRYRFWMKEMNFPIDIIWLSEDGMIVDMHTDVSPSTYPEVFRPREPVRYVLELPAGFAKANNLKIGDRIDR